MHLFPLKADQEEVGLGRVFLGRMARAPSNKRHLRALISGKDGDLIKQPVQIRTVSHPFKAVMSKIFTEGIPLPRRLHRWLGTILSWRARGHVLWCIQHMCWL